MIAGAFLVTYTDASSIPRRISSEPADGFASDSRLRWTFDLDVWELGLKAARHDDELADRERRQRALQHQLYGCPTGADCYYCRSVGR